MPCLKDTENRIIMPEDILNDSLIVHWEGNGLAKQVTHPQPTHIRVGFGSGSVKFRVGMDF